MTSSPSLAQTVAQTTGRLDALTNMLLPTFSGPSLPYTVFI